MYLHKMSKHPYSQWMPFPHGLGVTGKRIYSTEWAYRDNRKKIMNTLSRQGYNKTSTLKIMRNVDMLERKNLMEYKVKSSDNESRVPLIVPDT